MHQTGLTRFPTDHCLLQVVVLSKVCVYLILETQSLHWFLYTSLNSFLNFSFPSRDVAPETNQARQGCSSRTLQIGSLFALLGALLSSLAFPLIVRSKVSSSPEPNRRIPQVPLMASQWTPQLPSFPSSSLPKSKMPSFDSYSAKTTSISVRCAVPTPSGRSADTPTVPVAR